MQTLNLEECYISGRSNASACSSIMGSSSSCLVGDYIGIESCLDLKDNNDDIFMSSSKEKESYSVLRSRRDERWGSKKEKKEFPPPIPLLARTENLPCHMPWVLKRYYTSDGRLILKEERVRHHGYFRAQRSNGRLTLQLVPLDDEVYHPHYSSTQEDNNENDHCPDQDELHQEKEKEKEQNVLENILNEEENENELEKCCNEEEEEAGKIECKDNGRDKEEGFDDCSNDILGNGIMKKEFLDDHDQRMTSMDNTVSSGIGGNVSAFKCFNYNTVTMRPASTCIFQMPVPAMRPIHS